MAPDIVEVDGDELLSIPYVASLLHIPEKKMHKLISLGRVKTIKRDGRWRISRNRLTRWIDRLVATQENAFDLPMEDDPQAPRKRRCRAPVRHPRSITPSQRFAVLERSGFACSYCGRRPPEIVLVVDHIVPVVAGGTADDSNLTAACRECNSGKGSRVIAR